MADAIVSSLFQVIFETLNSFIVQQFGSAWGLKKELEKLESTLSTIQAVLHDAEKKQTKSEAVKNWLIKLREVAYDASEIADEFSIEAALQRPEIRGGAIKQVSNFFSLRNPLLFRYKMAQKIKDVVERLDKIAKEKAKFHFREGGMMEIQISSDEADRRQTSSFVTETAIYGRDEEKEMIIQQVVLADVNREEDVSIHALVGMGGLGKTTLAQLIYSDERITNHFELKIWVCVSDDFKIIRLTKAIIESSSEKTASDISELHPLQCRLREILNAKKFLLVLDDVWNEDQEEWDKLKSVLRCGSRGSLIIVTTRSEKVASIMATVLPWHRLGLLSENDGWSLFRHRAFGSKEREEDPNLITVGRDILKKCGGVPLAIKAISGLLRFKMKESEWLAIKESETWEILDEKNGILPSLRLSYNHLSLHLRQCFAYCSIFPKDHRLGKEYLIEAWMANGFIPSKGQMDLEEIGEEVFNNLLWRSFFQEPSGDEFGNVYACKMHDLMHDLALSVTGNECAMVRCDTDSTQKVPTGVRHLLYEVGMQQYISWNEDLNKLQSLRSFHLLSYGPSSACIPLDILGKSSLRLLELTCSDIHKWPSFIHKCKHLRLLDLSYSNIEVLHESTTCLQNLQTLKLYSCHKLHKLPKGMRHMRNLRRLNIDDCSSLSHMPSRMGQLTGLRTLSTFIVGKDSGRQIGELEDLNKLHHGIEIKGMYNVKSASDAKKADLTSKKNLESLTLTWRSVDPSRDDAFQAQEVANNIDHEKALEEVLESLRPPTNLKTLVINGYEGSKFPTWTADQLLVNLVSIKLVGCGRTKYLNSLGRLPSLASLRIAEMNAVKVFWDDKELVVGVDTIIHEKSFPALKTLHVNGMPNLESWTRSEGREVFPCLEDLSILGCHSLVGLPQSQTLKTLSIVSISDSLLKSIGNLTSLVSLELSHTFKLSHSKFDNPSTDVGNSHPRRSGELTYIPEEIRSLVCLESLEISYCDILSLPMEGLQGLRSLTRLSIQNCSRLESLSEGVQYLTMLNELFINGCPKLTSLPEGMQHLTSLESLTILYCDGLSSLPEFVGNLASLSHFVIVCCKNITSLPEGLHHNTTLRTLMILDCRHLEQRYNKETGENWHKIAHIPKVDIRDSWP